MTLKVRRRKFTVDDYYKMAEVGILGEDERVELIDGEIIEMAPIGPHHAFSVSQGIRVFVLTFADVAVVRAQSPVRLNNHEEPEPDLALVRPRPGYASGHPTPDDVFLIVEVADTSVRYDREIKALRYARAGIPDYWMFDVNEDAIIVFRDPSPEGYRTVFTVRRGDRIALLAFPDRELAVDDLLDER